MKNQMASLLSFSSDAYLNEMGISNRLNPNDVTTVCKVTTDPEDTENDIDLFARFMRATKAPSRDNARAATADAQAGRNIFDSIGCDICHVMSITTAPVGTVINGGGLTLSASPRHQNNPSLPAFLSA